MTPTGTVYAFVDAVVCCPNSPLNTWDSYLVVGIVPTTSGHGYWLDRSNGATIPFGAVIGRATSSASSTGGAALALSGFSDVLQPDAGGVGQIALHGPVNSSSIGLRVSHGCIHFPYSAILFLANLGTPLGTTVTII